ncbi:hypothetical protein AOQ84DRAFT_353366 [Glonium stellatum]|uniref:Uncharacterized protein n=1 Tax=Glonium stellatum TaxID=574774 RepID=A0A8E2F6C4_9PEZI|nr:hypothetical protein AOQ84DRAFT_353366 [Glonium stellatum]
MVPPKVSTRSKSTPNNKRKTKKSEHSTKESSNNQGGINETSASSAVIPLELHQSLLNIFKTSFTERLNSNFTILLQEIKQHLYNRDFLKAFGQHDYLETYAARWSPSRALGYLEIFNHVSDYIFMTEKQPSEKDSLHRIVCLGGGAGAEIVALAGFLNLFHREVDEGGESLQLKANSKITKHSERRFEVVAVDIADWIPVVESLQTSITTAPPLSKYAPAAVKDANAPLAMPNSFHVTFRQHDILSVDFSELSSLLRDANLVTLMFTLLLTAWSITSSCR